LFLYALRRERYERFLPFASASPAILIVLFVFVPICVSTAIVAGTGGGRLGLLNRQD